MISQNQTTIAKPVTISGRGLFTGQPVNLTFKPSLPGSGVAFVRTDTADPIRIAATIENVAKRPRRTALQNGTVVVETVEHCLAAIFGLGIDNLDIEIDGLELPNVDGSCGPYTEALTSAGIAEQNSPREVFVVTTPIVARHKGGLVYALPDANDSLNILYDLDYDDVPAIGRQLFRLDVTPEGFAKEISPARTFLPESEARQFQSQGIGTHLSAKDILVLGDDGPVDNELRFADECVRHKIADLLGDMMLLGRPIRGRIVASRSGHTCNQLLVKKLNKLIESQDRRNLLGSDAVLDIRKIQNILPHRYPFLLVDRVVEIEGDHRAVGIKNVTINEPFFHGHFPGTPIMPGVLIVEAMAQMSGLLFAQRLEHTGQLAVLLSMDHVKMRRAVVPGDQLVLEVQAVRIKSRTASCKCRAMVTGQTVAEAQIRFMLVDADPV